MQSWSQSAMIDCTINFCEYSFDPTTQARINFGNYPGATSAVGALGLGTMWRVANRPGTESNFYDKDLHTSGMKLALACPKTLAKDRAH